MCTIYTFCSNMRVTAFYQPISRKLHPGAMCTIYTFCSNMRVSAFYSPFFVNCTQVQIFQTGVKKLKITVEYDFSSFCTNYAPPSFGMKKGTPARPRLCALAHPGQWPPNNNKTQLLYELEHIEFNSFRGSTSYCIGLPLCERLGCCLLQELAHGL